MKKYIDCDGVILDTENGLFEEYYKLKQNNPELKKKRYLQEINWEYWIEQSEILNDAINILKNYNPKDIDILTKVHSLKEAVAKIKYFRKHKVENNVIIVPDEIQKSQIVNASGNILVDDSDRNLYDWESNDGIGFSFGKGESQFPKLNSLDDILNHGKVKRLLLSKQIRNNNV